MKFWKKYSWWFLSMRKKWGGGMGIGFCVKLMVSFFLYLGFEG